MVHEDYEAIYTHVRRARSEVMIFYRRAWCCSISLSANASKLQRLRGLRICLPQCVICLVLRSIESLRMAVMEQISQNPGTDQRRLFTSLNVSMRLTINGPYTKAISLINEKLSCRSVYLQLAGVLVVHVHRALCPQA